jgi:hypothetical protein
MLEWNLLRALVNELGNIAIRSQLGSVAMETVWEKTGGFEIGRTVLK